MIETSNFWKNISAASFWNQSFSYLHFFLNLNRSGQVSFAFVNRVWCWFNVCCNWKCQHWICITIHSMWNDDINNRTRILKFGWLHWHRDKFTFMGFFGWYYWTPSCFNDFNGWKFYVCTFISIFIQCDNIDSITSLGWNIVSLNLPKW